MSQSNTNICANCGASLPNDAPSGNCPRCLLDLGLDQGGWALDLPELPRRFGTYELL